MDDVLHVLAGVQFAQVWKAKRWGWFILETLAAGKGTTVKMLQDPAPDWVYLIDGHYCPVDGWTFVTLIFDGEVVRSLDMTIEQENGVRHYWDSRIKDRLLRPVTKLQNGGVDFWAWTNFSVRGWHRIRYYSSWQGGNLIEHCIGWCLDIASW